MMPSLPALSLVSTRLRHSGRSRTASTMLFTGLLLGRSSVMCQDMKVTIHRFHNRLYNHGEGPY